MVPGDGTRGSGGRMEHRKLLNIRKHVVFFTMGVTKHWSSLLREIAESLSFEIFKRHLDMVLDNGL